MSNLWFLSYPSNARRQVNLKFQIFTWISWLSQGSNSDIESQGLPCGETGAQLTRVFPSFNLLGKPQKKLINKSRGEKLINKGANFNYPPRPVKPLNGMVSVPGVYSRSLLIWLATMVDSVEYRLPVWKARISNPSRVKPKAYIIEASHYLPWRSDS